MIGSQRPDNAAREPVRGIGAQAQRQHRDSAGGERRVLRRRRGEQAVYLPEGVEAAERQLVACGGRPRRPAEARPLLRAVGHVEPRDVAEPAGHA